MIQKEPRIKYNKGMAEEKDSSQHKKSENIDKPEKEAKGKKDKKLDSYDQILLDTFPASDSVAKY